VNRDSGRSLSGLIKTLSPAWKDVADTPESGFTVNMTSLMDPRISSTLPMRVLFSRKAPALKYGTLSLVLLYTISFSHACRKEPSSAGH
jgi:hypothetical protein